MFFFQRSFILINFALLLLGLVALHDALADKRSSQMYVRRRMHNEAVEMFNKRLEGKIGPPTNIPKGIPEHQAFVAPEAGNVNDDPQSYVVAHKQPTWNEKCGEQLDAVQDPPVYGYMVANFASMAGNHVYQLAVSCVQTSDDTTSNRPFTIVKDFSSTVLGEVGWTKASAQAQAAKLPGGGGGSNNKPGGGGPNNKPGGGGSNNKPGGGSNTKPGGGNKPKNGGGGPPSHHG